MSNSTKLPALTVSTYDFKNMTFGNEIKNVDYGFSKYTSNYSHEGTNISDNMIKITNVKVLGVYPPNPEHKNPKYTVLFGIEDNETKEFGKQFDKHLLEYVYENRVNLFNDEELSMEDLEANYKPVFKINDNGNMSITISFPFNNPSVKNPIEIYYKQDNLDSEVIRSTDLIKKLGKGSVCDIFLHFTNLYKDSTDKFKMQTTIYRKINVIEYNNLESLGGSFRPSMKISDINTDDIIMGNVVTNDKQGRSLQPKYGEGKKSLSVNLEGMFRFVKFVDQNTNEPSFNVVYNIPEDELQYFENLDNFMKNDLYTNYAKYEKNGKTTKKNLDKKFRGVVKEDKEGNKNMWFKVYAKKLEDGTYDFSGNFYKTDGTSKYTNEEIYNNVFGEEFKGSMNIYFKHIWFGKFYSCKFNMGGVMIDINNVEYDLDDGIYFDGHKSENSKNVINDDSNDLDKVDEPDNSDDTDVEDDNKSNNQDNDDTENSESENSESEDEDEDDD
jgi:hypothetical protein